KARRRDQGPAARFLRRRGQPVELSGSNRDVPPAVDRVVRHCLEKQPDDRFQSARDIVFALSEVSTSSPSSGRGGGSRHLPWRQPPVDGAAGITTDDDFRFFRYSRIQKSRLKDSRW